MQTLRIFCSLLVFGGWLTACAHADRIEEQSAIVNAMRPGLLGSSLHMLSKRDQAIALTSEYQALESVPVGQSLSWKARDSRAFGDITAGQPYQVGSQNCRQYNHTFTIDDIPRSTRGSACRNADGTWTPLS